ncbi:unnamed protein product [Caenorhabditis brenneri]
MSWKHLGVHRVESVPCHWSAHKGTTGWSYSGRLAVLSKAKITSVENCRMYRKSNWCDIVKTTCTIASFKFSPVRKVPMFDGVFTMELDSSTFVATTLKKFVVWNGSHAHVEDVYESGQFMLESPVGWQAYFGWVTMVGNVFMIVS